MLDAWQTKWHKVSHSRCQLFDRHCVTFFSLAVFISYYMTCEWYRMALGVTLSHDTVNAVDKKSDRHNDIRCHIVTVMWQTCGIFGVIYDVTWHYVTLCHSVSLCHTMSHVTMSHSLSSFSQVNSLSQINVIYGSSCFMYNWSYQSEIYFQNKCCHFFCSKFKIVLIRIF